MFNGSPQKFFTTSKFLTPPRKLDAADKTKEKNNIICPREYL